MSRQGDTLVWTPWSPALGPRATSRVARLLRAHEGIDAIRDCDLASLDTSSSCCVHCQPRLPAIHIGIVCSSVRARVSEKCVATELIQLSKGTHTKSY